MSVVGIVILSVNLLDSIFFNVFDQWTDSLLGIMGVGLILSVDLLKRWKQSMSPVSKTMIILTNILFVAALILTLFCRHETFLLDFGKGIMLVAFLTYIILFFRTEYKGE